MYLRCAVLRKSVPSRITSPAVRAYQRDDPRRIDVEELTRQLDVLVLDLNEVAILAEFRRIEEANRFTELRETDELLAVDADGVVEDTAAIDDGDRLVRAQ